MITVRIELLYFAQIPGGVNTATRTRFILVRQLGGSIMESEVSVKYNF